MRFDTPGTLVDARGRREKHGAISGDARARIRRRQSDSRQATDDVEGWERCMGNELVLPIGAGYHVTAQEFAARPIALQVARLEKSTRW